MAELERYDRRPFRTILTHLIKSLPEQGDLNEWARKNPDKWAQACAIFARAAGFHERTEVVHSNVFAVITSMSDAELMRRVQELESKITGKPTEPKLIESEADYEVVPRE